jgi:3alpha(or 20beta)-hydroxysteroid dehydrogenase
MAHSTPTSGRVAGKVVVVTGGANGQGEAETHLLASEGAQVICVDIEEPSRPLPAGARFHRVDVGSADDWSMLFDFVSAEYGRVDGLVNNAAMNAPDPLLTTQLEDFERVFAVNLTATLFAIQTFLPLMSAGGSIVNIGSLAALGANPGPYAVSKWALRGLGRTASLELGSRGIRVNTVHPGLINTKIASHPDPHRWDAAINMTALGRRGVPEDVAPAILYLISDESSYVTGTEMWVDGGRVGHGGAKGFTDAMELEQ